MNYVQVKGMSLPDTYHKALVALKEYGDIVPCPDYDTEMIECSMDMVVQKPLMEPMISKCGIYSPKDLQQYMLEIKDGIFDFIIGKDENLWEYTYHERIADQIPFVLEELKRNIWSRRAVIDVRKNGVDMFNDHPACLQHIQFLVRRDLSNKEPKLDMIVTMRSNDATQATFMNAFGFIMGLQKLIADNLGLELGHYVHRVGSFHAYKSHWKELFHAVSKIKESETKDLCYYYDSHNSNYLPKEPFVEWRPMMEASMEEIMRLVKDEKEKYGIE